MMGSSSPCGYFASSVVFGENFNKFRRSKQMISTITLGRKAMGLSAWS
jgi:hypothetical protein